MMGERFDSIVAGGQVVLEDGVRRQDIGIRDGVIVAISEKLGETDSANVIDAEGLWVLPGMIDTHVHFNEPGMGHWEGFATGSAALAAGGCTTYIDMPLNGLPPTINLDALKLKADLAKGSSAVDYAFWGGLVPGNLSDLELLHEAGVAGFKAFMSNPGGDGEGRFREIDDWSLHKGMLRIASFGGLLALHAESEAMTSELAEICLREGRTGALDFVSSRPPAAELEAVCRALSLAKRTGCRLHFVHISHPDSVEEIDRAKKQGVDVTVETCPHYLVLTDSDLERLGPVAKCAPPLRDAASVERLWEQAAEGKIDFIASDHSPCPEDLKYPPDGTFFDAWGGIAGAQSSLELMLAEGVTRRGLPLPLVSALLAGNPAKRFGLDRRKGRIAIGLDADLVLVDPEGAYTLSKEGLLQRHSHSPYLNREFPHRVRMTISRGRSVYDSTAGGVFPGMGMPAVSKPIREGSA
ncbi:allantoinase AllB [Cohnella faecalis]|uniref:allantoinase AllB n=1 Tax=Cohnella faecalis TaxID=2315694 RepID=UPI00360E3FA7